jgi:hypothetical protein
MVQGAGGSPNFGQYRQVLGETYKKLNTDGQEGLTFTEFKGVLKDNDMQAPFGSLSAKQQEKMFDFFNGSGDSNAPIDQNHFEGLISYAGLAGSKFNMLVEEAVQKKASAETLYGNTAEAIEADPNSAKAPLLLEIATLFRGLAGAGATPPVAAAPKDPTAQAQAPVAAAAPVVQPAPNAADTLSLKNGANLAGATGVQELKAYTVSAQGADGKPEQRLLSDIKLPDGQELTVSSFTGPEGKRTEFYQKGADGQLQLAYYYAADSTGKVSRHEASEALKNTQPATSPLQPTSSAQQAEPSATSPMPVETPAPEEATSPPIVSPPVVQPNVTKRAKAEEADPDPTVVEPTP